MAVIVISGYPGSGSSTTAKLLSKKTKLKFFSVGAYYKSHHEAKKETERAVKFWKTKKGSSKKFHESIDDMQIKLAKKGNIVIDSKLGIHFLKDYADYKVWIKAPVSVRAKRYAKRDTISVKEAMKILKEKEKLERESFAIIYGFDFFSLEKKADLIINVSKKKPQQIVNQIIKFMENHLSDK